MNTTSVLQFMDRAWVQAHVLLAHDRAREEYSLTKVAVADAAEFKRELGRYVQHHLRVAQGAEVSEDRAFSIAVETLNGSFPRHLLPDGYSAALASSTGGASGGLPDVFNALARALRDRGLRDLLEHVLHEVIDMLSRQDRLALGAEVQERFGKSLTTLGRCLNDLRVAQVPGIDAGAHPLGTGTDHDKSGVGMTVEPLEGRVSSRNQGDAGAGKEHPTRAAGTRILR